MPLFSYFTVVGGSLLAGLFAAHIYFPVQPLREHRPVDTSIIRIHSKQVTLPPVEIVVRAAPPSPADTASRPDVAVPTVRAGF